MVDIIVVGYPKSGNTWVTRLVADLVGCPVVGFLGGDHDEIAREGFDRKSDYRCFKSHHQFNKLQKFRSGTTKMIYVIRDPRDVCLSGSRYFRFEQFPLLRRLMGILPMGRTLYDRVDRILPMDPDQRIEKMMDAVLYGSARVDKWVRPSWRNHYKPYLDNGCFFVKFEDLLDDAEKECKRIISFLEIQRNGERIRNAIEAQSFKNKKEALTREGELHKAEFMKVGTKEQWRESLSKEHKEQFTIMLADDLTRFGYQPS